MATSEAGLGSMRSGARFQLEGERQERVVATEMRGNEIDPTCWPVVGGTSSGAYHEAEADVLVAAPKPDFEQTGDAARASLEELNRIVLERGRRAGLIVLIDRVRSQDGASRRIWQREMDPDLICALALVGGTMLGRAIGSFFMGVYRPSIQTVLVPSFDEAIDWVRDRVRTHGGPIES